MYRSYLFSRDINYNHESLASDEKKMLRRGNLSDRYSLQALLQKSFESKGEFYTKNMFTNNLPGDSEDYSMLGIALLALTVESSTGYFYDQYVDEFIFAPLSMTTATWTMPAPDADATSPHMGSSMDVIPDYNQNLYPMAGFRASTDDAKILLGAIKEGLAGNDKLLSGESWKTIFGGLVPKFQNLTVTEMNPAPIEALSSYNLSGYHVIGAQNYGSTSVLLIEPEKGEVIYFTSNTCFAHLSRGGYFLSEIMRLLVEPYE
jgi:CubicO group peptidase (beta-lactamase class C family)